MQVYEAGALFLSRFPHYMTYLAEETDLIIYTVGMDMESDASARPVSDFLNGLKSTVALARLAFEEQFVEEAEPE